MQPEDTSTTDATNLGEPAGYTDDTHVMRFLLHNIKGLSPVSGGELEMELVPEDVADSEGTVA